MDSPFPVGDYSRDERAGGGYLRRPPLEHCHAIYREKDHYGPVSGNSAALRRSVYQSDGGEKRDYIYRRYGSRLRRQRQKLTWGSGRDRWWRERHRTKAKRIMYHLIP